MHELLRQIEVALSQRLYFMALFVAVALPDMAGAIDSEDGEASKTKYVQWFDQYVAPGTYGLLNGEDCYYFRCSVLHQGTSQHRRSTYSRVLFVEPGTGIVSHYNVMNDVLNIDVNLFCLEIVAGCRKWLSEAAGGERFQQNYDMFMRRYPEGLPPYIVGVPVIG